MVDQCVLNITSHYIWVVCVAHSTGSQKMKMCQIGCPGGAGEILLCSN